MKYDKPENNIIKINRDGLYERDDKEKNKWMRSAELKHTCPPSNYLLFLFSVKAVKVPLTPPLYLAFFKFTNETKSRLEFDKIRQSIATRWSLKSPKGLKNDRLKKESRDSPPPGQAKMLNENLRVRVIYTHTSAQIRTEQLRTKRANLHTRRLDSIKVKTRTATEAVDDGWKRRYRRRRRRSRISNEEERRGERGKADV